jgi:predicted nucleic acid-binding Zn ribbon protein
MPQPTPEQRPTSVATLPSDVPVYCPVCETVPLHGKQTVCSPRCRIQRSMGRRAAKQAERDAKVRLLLGEALALLVPNDN